METSSGLRRQARKIIRGLRLLFGAMERRAQRHSIGGRAHVSLAHGDEGGALLEIALTMPVLLGMVTGICAFGLTFSNQLTLTQAVGSAGQYLSQIRSSTTDPCADAFTALKNAAPNLASANIAMTVVLNGTNETGNSCSGKQTLLVQGSPVTVYATYPCSLAVYGVKFASSCQLSAKVTEYEY